MKNITTLLLTLLVLGGCVSVAPTTKIIQVSHDIKVISKDGVDRYGQPILTHEWKSVVVKNYDRLITGVDAYRAEAMSIETGEKFHIGNYPHGLLLANRFPLKKTILENCERLFDSKCVLTKETKRKYEKEPKNARESLFMSEVDIIYYSDLQDYYLKEKEREEKAEQERIAERLALEKKKEEEQQMKQDAFNKLYSTCLSYGFEERSSIASCIQQEIFNEKKLALLKQQQLAQMAYVNQQQIKEQEETNIWLLLLEGVAENLADPNTWENARQNAEIQKLKRQQIFRN